MDLSLGFSPCPNDCFIFYALAHHKVAPEFGWSVRLEDVEALNQLARCGVLDVSKISYHAYGHLQDEYVMLRSGGALGNGVGPLIVAREELSSLSGRRVAIPGGLTTANLLLRLSQPDDVVICELRYDRIMPAVAAGEVDAGLIIHESRFTYPEYGLRKFLDVGEWWHRETGLLLPLGGIMAKRSLGTGVLGRLEVALRESLQYAYAHRAEAQPYIAAHAQEMSEVVMQKHIDLYVNEYSVDVGEAGERAVRELLRLGRERGFIPPSDAPAFLPGEA
ncbi:MAG TPA: 1,4-dihydroxy-6-naphthoate synthase [Trueperaceae bacterium]